MFACNRKEVDAAETEFPWKSTEISAGLPLGDKKEPRANSLIPYGSASHFRELSSSPAV